MKDKKIILIVIIGTLFLILGIILIITSEPKVDASGYTLIDDLKIDVYSKKKVNDLIKKLDGKLLTNNKIDTEKLGKQEIKFIYKNKDGKKRTGIINVNIVDQEEPLVWLSNSYSVKVGSQIDLNEEILCADNYDSNPNCRIEGDYDLNTAGVYNLTYVATDSSNNEEKVNFRLNVYEPEPIVEKEEPQEEPVRTVFKEVLENYKKENTEIGLDVSKWQGEIDFKKVKEAGATFVMIRVGSQQGVGGQYNLDPYFKQNIENAIKNDLKVGVYFYSYADSNKEAKKQADWVLKQINLFGLNEVAESFLEKIEDAGYDGMLYGSKNYLNSIWKYQSYDVWLAHYTKETDYASDYVMWQLCQDGQIDGINTAVDINVLYRNDKDNK